LYMLSENDILTMNNYTLEQQEYILYKKKCDTKLLACAGSGKTRCIIAKIEYLIKNNIYKKSEILVLTFSRFTRDDFLNKIISYDALNIDPNNIKTIDSFAKSMIDKNNEIDISLLSYKFMKYLNETKKLILKKNNELIKIK